MTHFGIHLAEALHTHGPLCVGLDPHAGLLSQWSLPDTPAGLRTFSERVVEAAAGRCAAVKPQSAFYERHGAAGVAVLEEVLSWSKEAGLLTVLDVKRGDIGSTMGAYAAAHLLPDAPLAADAITISPYLGYDSLRPAIEMAGEHGKGVFVLGLTSNPEGAQVQLVGEPSVAARVFARVGQDNEGAQPFGHVGLVVGATLAHSWTDLQIDPVAAHAPILAPGVGAQGADAGDVARTFAGLTDRVLVPISRAILEAGPDQGQLRTAATEWTHRLRSALQP